MAALLAILPQQLVFGLALGTVYGLIALVTLIAGAIGYGVRSFYSYLRTREKHQLSLTRHLYFQTSTTTPASFTTC